MIQKVPRQEWGNDLVKQGRAKESLVEAASLTTQVFYLDQGRWRVEVPLAVPSTEQVVPNKPRGT